MRLLAAALFVIVAVSGCKDQTTEGKKVTVEKLPMAPHCIGRTVISLPASYVLADGGTGVFKLASQGEQDGPINVTVRASRLTPAQFKAALANHRGELLAKATPTVDLLKHEQDFDARGTLFRIQNIDDAYRSEISFLVGSSFVTASLDSYGNKFLKAEEALTAFANAVHEADRADAGQGAYCLGPIRIAGNLTSESARVLFRSDAFKGTSFGLTTDTYQPDDAKTLLKRMSGPDSLMTAFEVGQTELRARELTIGTVRAQEWLGFMKTKPKQGGKKYIFALETMRDVPSKQAPHLHVAFDTGDALEDGSYAPVTLSNEEAMAMWDAVVGSIAFAGR